MAAMLLALWLLVACAADVPVSPQGGDDEMTVQILFSLNCQLPGAGSRTEVWGDLDDTYEATAFENYIGNLRVFVMPSSSCDVRSSISTIELEDVCAISATHYSGSCTIDASNLNDDGTLSGWIVATANFSDDDLLGESLSASNITSLDVFDTSFAFQNNDDINSGRSLIPLFGILRCDNISLAKGVGVQVGSLYMMRSLAKVRVSPSAESAALFRLTGATLTSANSTFYLSPDFSSNCVNDAFEYTSLYDLPVASTIHPWESFAPCSLPFIDGGDGSFYVYMPEMTAAQAATSGMATLHLEYQNMETNVSYSDDINIGDYPDPQGAAVALDIIRNTVYDYTVTILPSDVRIALTVLPWDVVTTNVGWTARGDDTAGIDAVLYAWQTTTKDVSGITYYNCPDTDDASIGDSEALYCYVSYPGYAAGTGNTAVADAATSADFYLLITGAEGLVWQAHLTNEEDFEFDVSAASAWDCTYWDGSAAAVKQLYAVSAGLARATVTAGDAAYCRPYKISVRPKKKWYTIPDDAEADSNGNYTYSSNWSNTDDGTTWESNADYLNDNGEVVSGPYTDLYITVELSGGTDVSSLSYLYINPQYDNGALTSYYLDSSQQKRYRFAPGSSVGGVSGTTVRIWQLKATSKDDATMVSDNIANEFFTTRTSN